jgi:pimeloyl-ACP methyl ester carboxylesterase
MNATPLESWETARYSIRGIDYALTDTGGDGPAVMLLHGWPDDRSLWRHQGPYLAQRGFRVIAVDWPSHGDSARGVPVARHHVRELGLDTVALLDALGVDKVHLVAHDYGATVSWETVADHPQRFHSYCAISVGHSLEIVGDILRGRLFGYLWLILHGMPRTSRAWYLSRDARRFRRAFASHPDASRILSRLTDGGEQTFWTVWEQANPAWEVLWRYLRSRRRSIPVPVLGVYSTQDEWMSEAQMRRSGAHVSAAWRYERLDGGHWVPLQHPDAVNALLGDWLAEQTADQPQGSISIASP